MKVDICNVILNFWVERITNSNYAVYENEDFDLD